MRGVLLLFATILAISASPAAQAHTTAGVIVCFEAIPAPCTGDCVDLVTQDDLHLCKVVTLPL